jgi:hypothetical protein
MDWSFKWRLIVFPSGIVVYTLNEDPIERWLGVTHGAATRVDEQRSSFT